MSKLFRRLGWFALAFRFRAAPAPVSASGWSSTACKVLALNLAETTVKRSRWR